MMDMSIIKYINAIFNSSRDSYNWNISAFSCRICCINGGILSWPSSFGWLTTLNPTSSKNKKFFCFDVDSKCLNFAAYFSHRFKVLSSFLLSGTDTTDFIVQWESFKKTCCVVLLVTLIEKCSQTLFIGSKIHIRQSWSFHNRILFFWSAESFDRKSSTLFFTPISLVELNCFKILQTDF